MSLTFKGRQLADVEVDDVDTRDYPDFCDAFISNARWADTGDQLTDAEIDEVNEDRDLVYDAVHRHVF
jgi:hypothetical protein